MGETYNGWATRETWLVVLWLGNEEETERDVRALVSQWDAESSEEGGTLSQLGDFLAEYVEQLLDRQAGHGTATLATDLLGAALGRVEWRSIAEAYVSDLADAAELARRQERYLDTLRARR